MKTVEAKNHTPATKRLRAPVGLHAVLVLLLLAGSLGAQSSHDKPPLDYSGLGVASGSGVVSEGPFIEIISRRDGVVDVLRITNADGKEQLVVHKDGTIETGEGFNADETARAFWKALAKAYPQICNEAKPEAARP